jgi:type II secretory pathway component PulF
MFFVLPTISIFIWPKLKMILEDMEAAPPAFTVAVFENFGIATAIQVVFLGLIISLGVMYIAGPRIQIWARAAFGSLPDWIALALPWRRARAHRDFTAALAILLDAGLREPHAVKLAAQATGNDVFEWRAARVLEQLNEGIALPDALAKVERSREFQWRWANALRAGKDFFAALRGWHESLETRAFQQEQAAAHTITAAMVIINGAIVGAMACALFLIIISLIEEGTLW